MSVLAKAKGEESANSKLSHSERSDDTGDVAVTSIDFNLGGQIDALYVDRARNCYLIDFKRIAKNHKLDSNELGFCSSHNAEPVCGLGPMAHLPDTPITVPALLAADIYNLILLNTYGIDVEDRMYLLRVHTDCPAFERVQSPVP